MKITERINEHERQLNELKASLKEEAKDNRPITERVKTFEDALDILGEEHLFVRSYREWMMVRIHKQNDIDAYLKLRIITAALNEGWEPQFAAGEYRYYPWFTKEDGVAKYEITYSDSTGMGVGTRLCFKTRELAQYAGRQFADLYADYLLVRK